MNKEKLAKKSLLYLVGNLSSKLLTVIIIPIYAFYISVDDLGYFDYSQTIMNIMMPIVFFAIWESVLKFILVSEENGLIEKIISNVVIFSLFVSILFVPIFFIVNKYINLNYSLFILLSILFSGYAQIWQYFSRSLKENNVFVVSGILATVINFISILFFVVNMDFGIKGLFLSYLFGQFTIVFFIEYKLRIISKVKLSLFNLPYLKELLMFSSPLVLNLISAWFISGYSRYFIMRTYGSELSGLYSFANKFSQIITILGSVIVMAMIEEAIMSEKDKEFGIKFSKTILSVYNLFLALTILLLPAVRIFYWFLNDFSYLDSLFFVPFLLIYSMYMTLSSSIGSIFQVLNKTQHQFTTTLFAGISTVVLTEVLNQFIGVYSVVIGQLIGALILFFSRYLLSKKYIVLNVKIPYIVITTVLLLIFFIFIINKNVIISVIVFLVSTVAIAVIYRKVLINIFKMIIKKVGK